MSSLDLNLWPSVIVLLVTAMSVGALRVADAWAIRRARIRGEQLLSKAANDDHE